MLKMYHECCVPKQYYVVGKRAHTEIRPSEVKTRLWEMYMFGNFC